MDEVSQNLKTQFKFFHIYSLVRNRARHGQYKIQTGMADQTCPDIFLNRAKACTITYKNTDTNCKDTEFERSN